jgi:hypothetical protein
MEKDHRWLALICSQGEYRRVYLRSMGQASDPKIARCAQKYELRRSWQLPSFGGNGLRQHVTLLFHKEKTILNLL